MVCKEDILLWFKESASYKRIDVICNLLNMCIPFELRFVGTFVETIGKHSYQELRGAELKANNPSEIAAEVATASGLSDGTFRRKITLYLSLLHSYNHTCAKNIFDILTSSDLGDILSKGGASSPGDGNVLEELLLLYTMALNHPAFSFEQHTCLGKILMQLLEEEKMVHSQSVQFSVPIQRVPLALQKNYFVVKMQDEIPTPAGPIALPGPPPGIPLAPRGDQTVVGQQMQWGAPNPPSPHFAHTQQESPVHSRTSSPVNNQSIIHPASRPQQNTISRRPPFQNKQDMPTRKMVNCVEDKDGDIPPAVNQAWRNNTRCHNGLRNCSARTNQIICQSSMNCQHVYCTSQLDNLNIHDTDVVTPSSRHCSSSSESGRSSTSHSPPGTPHTPGRRKSDTTRPSAPPVANQQQAQQRSTMTNGRVSSNPSAESAAPGSTVLSQPQPPPGGVVFTQTQPNVPFTGTAYTIPAQAAFANNRSSAMFTTYPPQSYRPPPTAAFTYTQPNGTEQLMYPYHPAPFLPLIAAYPPPPPATAAAPPPVLPPPKLSCWNCGASGHTGHDCTEPTIEEITRPGNYQIDFSTSTTPTAAATVVTPAPDCTSDK